MSKTLDLSQCKSPAAAAKKLHKWLCEKAKELDMNPDIEIWIKNPTESNQHGTGKCWHVSWESGPFEWATWLLGGASMYAGESDGRSMGEPEVIIEGAEKFRCECYWSFSIQFWPY